MVLTTRMGLGESDGSAIQTSVDMESAVFLRQRLEMDASMEGSTANKHIQCSVTHQRVLRNGAGLW